jgi:hypothetical protein
LVHRPASQARSPKLRCPGRKPSPDGASTAHAFCYRQIDFVQQPLLSFWTQTKRWYFLHLAVNFGGHRGFTLAADFFFSTTKRCVWSAALRSSRFANGAAMSAPEKAIETNAISPNFTIRKSRTRPPNAGRWGIEGFKSFVTTVVSLAPVTDTPIR